MASWTTQEISLSAKVGSVVSKEFLVREPQYLVVEITGVTGTPTVSIEDSADGSVFTNVSTSSAITPVSGRVVFRFDASISGNPLRNICRISTSSSSFDKVYVTWSP